MLKQNVRPATTVILGLCLCALAASPGLAQSSLGIGTAEPSIAGGGTFASVFSWINAQQQEFYRAMSGALKAMREDPAKLWVLIGLSFAYGVFHAAGPGHGKAVISSYVIANEQTLRRGVVISFLAAFMQGVVAIAIVGVTYLALHGTSISMRDATHTLEIASYALIAAFGAWLLIRKLRPLMRAVTPAFAHAEAAGAPHHHHDHDHSHIHHSHAHSHDHDHSHGHEIGADGVCSTCGHSHAPDPARLQAERLDLREAWSAIVAIGLRPCSGALIVLTFALLNGLFVGGVLSVAAMSIGTAITVSILATLAVMAKNTAVRFASSQSAAARVGTAIEITGALFVLLIGLTLLFAALQA
ncbi:nickel/cobalt transporter [Hoeflea prorocentri]|uniref:Nickel/cobalt efflux system n=1 Tax=Hoeflea prorocentri TaxID=1922333 RepID=A0A9X3UDB2_9HYPH|nr:nickel/cobalt transporter [Hoeflea prorocentri]MCY6379186.1 nickel/cobalt transporter [Hoeflea prorocentri]MDA5396987.1 nickel/cobalt transporter [Hoeflea prorocentri]